MANHANTIFTDSSRSARSDFLTRLTELIQAGMAPPMLSVTSTPKRTRLLENLRMRLARKICTGIAVLQVVAVSTQGAKTKKRDCVQSGKKRKQVQVPTAALQNSYVGEVLDEIVPQNSDRVYGKQDIYDRHPDNRYTRRWYVSGCNT